MPRVPEYTPNVSLRPELQSDFSVRANAEHFGAAVGRGMQQAAQGMANLGDAVSRVKAIMDDTAARDARNKFMADADAEMYGENGYSFTTGKTAIDAYPEFGRRLEDIRRKHAQTLTPEQQAIFNKAVDVDAAQRKRTALIHRGNETKKFAVSTHEAGAQSFLDEAVRSRGDAEQSRMYLGAAQSEMESLGQLQGLPQEAINLKKADLADSYYSRVALEMVNEDPVAAVDYVQQNISAMSPDAANKLLTSLAKPLGQAAGQDAIRIAPTRIAPDVQTRGQQAMSYFMEQGFTKEQAAGIVGNLIAESNLMPSGAVGDKGTAFGIAQWRGERLTRLKRFAAAQGKSWEDYGVQLAWVVQELKTHEKHAYQALMNASTVDEATAAFIHFERPAGWSKGNPRGGHNYRGRLNHALGMAGKDVKAGDVDTLEGGGLAFSEKTEKVISGLPAYMQSQVRDIAMGQVNSHRASEAAAFKAEQAATVDNYKLRIATGDVELTTQEILSDQRLDDGDKATLVTSYNSKFDDLRRVQDGIASFNAGTLRVDPYSSDDRKLVDGMWGQFVRNGNGDNALAVLPQIVQQTGVIPTPVFNAIRGAVTGTNAGNVVQGLNMALMLSDADQTAFAKRDGGKDIQDALALYRHYSGKLGMTPEQAVSAIIDSRDPEKRKAQAALVESKPAKDWIEEQATTKNVGALFSAEDGNWFFYAPLGDNPVQEAAMLGEYREVLSMSLFETAGNFDAAKAVADDRFKRRYGVTSYSVTGNRTITRLPVERTYRPGADGTHKYIGEQAKTMLKGEGITADKVYFLSDDLTDRDVEAGQPARYRVFYQDDNGVLEEFNKPMSFDAPTPEQIAEEKTRGARNRLAENRAQMKRGRDREGNLDRYLDGDPLTGELRDANAAMSLTEDQNEAQGLNDAD